jgi:electron transfer flavoprotein beta subunit
MKGKGLGIVVPIALVHDCQYPVIIDPASKRIEPSSFHWVLNPPDTIALEQALRIKDRFPGSWIRGICICPPFLEGILRECLAAGADEVVRVWEEGAQEADPHGIAVILAATIRTWPFHLILAGWRRADVEHGQTGPILAELLGLRQVTSARSIDPRPDSGEVRIEQRASGKIFTLSCPLPALVTVEKGPMLRYPKFPDRRKAARAAVLCLGLDSIGLTEIPSPLIRLERMTPPKPKRRSALGAVAGLSAVAMLQRIVSGGAPARRDGNIHHCPDKMSALKVARLILDEKLVTLP